MIHEKVYNNVRFVYSHLPYFPKVIERFQCFHYYLQNVKHSIIRNFQKSICLPTLVLNRNHLKTHTYYKCMSNFNATYILII